MYLSLIGVKTNQFNYQIKNTINSYNKDLDIELKEISLKLNPFKFKVSAKTLGSKIISRDKVLEIESIKSNISLFSILKDEFVVENLNLSTKSIVINDMIWFLNTFYKRPEIIVLEKILKVRGFLIANLNFEFDSQGNLKDNFVIKGYVKDTKFGMIKDYELENLNFIFNLKKNNFDFEDVRFSLNKINFQSNSINLKKLDKGYSLNGVLNNDTIVLNKNNLLLLKNNFFPNLSFEKIEFSSNNKFSLSFDDNFKIKDRNLISNIDLKNIKIFNNYNLKNILPEINEEIIIKNNYVKIRYSDDTWMVDGKGKVLLQNKEDEIDYKIEKNSEVVKFNGLVSLNKDPFVISFLNFKKNKDTKTKIFFKGYKNLQKKLFLETINLIEDKNKIEAKNIYFDTDLKIRRIDNFYADYKDAQGQKNFFDIKRDKKNYIFTGDEFNADALIENLLIKDSKTNFIKDNFDLIVKLKNVRLDNEFNLMDLSGNFRFKNQNIFDANLKGNFKNQKKMIFTVRTSEKNTVTTLFLDYAKPIVKRYKFIKGFEGGVLDFNSVKNADTSSSTLKIYDFKLKELPTLTKLLTLASLQGIADVLSGEGIRFDEFEMQFKNNKKLMTINEVYAIGPAISVLMDGYIEKNKLISLRGTLVPATTINKVIGTIPVLGKILVGSKTGEGVFGVSFKVKGPPKNLETTVNPIKTLTPRFITRTLEKIKKN
tara:strand:- start:1074 stop:3203 length:2130 start_codon:yes stop_codon:yes gene_type:complete